VTFDPAQMTDPQQIAYGLNIASVLETWIEQLRKRAHAIRKDTGVEIPGYDWIERSAKREITNPVGAFEVVTKEFGVTPEAFLSATKISITQLSAVVADAAPKGEKGKTEELLTSRLMDTMVLTRGASFHVLQRSKKKAPKKADAITA
jgi:translation initiation factor 2B subunit (eIF-2B alpha/beta/delta family)